METPTRLEVLTSSIGLLLYETQVGQLTPPRITTEYKQTFNLSTFSADVVAMRHVSGSSITEQAISSTQGTSTSSIYLLWSSARDIK